jgi:NAD(P)H-hydrate epimerase
MSPSPPHSAASRTVHVLDRAGVRSVDRAAVEEYGVPSIVLMENAARALAQEALAMLAEADGDVALIICGSGNNGGDGWALARHLHNAGVSPVVAPLGAPRAGTDAAVNAAICRRMEIAEIAPDRLDDVPSPALVVDAIFGTGLDRPVAGAAADAIAWINAWGGPVLAVDIPSGMDGDTGRALGVMVRATCTVSFVGAKPGFAAPGASDATGRVVIGDIGAPRELTLRFARRRSG